MTDNMSDCADTSVIGGCHGRSEKFIKAVAIKDADFLLRILELRILELIASLFRSAHGN